MLYFPPGSGSSLSFAVPVLSDQTLIDAINALTEAVKKSNENGHYATSCTPEIRANNGSLTQPAVCNILDTRTGELVKNW